MPVRGTIDEPTAFPLSGLSVQQRGPGPRWPSRRLGAADHQFTWRIREFVAVFWGLTAKNPPGIVESVATNCRIRVIHRTNHDLREPSSLVVTWPGLNGPGFVDCLDPTDQTNQNPGAEGPGVFLFARRRLVRMPPEVCPTAFHLNSPWPAAKVNPCLPNPILRVARLRSSTPRCATASSRPAPV